MKKFKKLWKKQKKNQVDQDSIDEIVVETPLVADIDAPEVEEQRESVSNFYNL